MSEAKVRRCLCCHKNFYPNKQYIKLCSDRCKELWDKGYKVCPICKNLFYVMLNPRKKIKDRRKVYCSPECFKKSRRTEEHARRKERYNSDESYREKILAKQRAYYQTESGRAAVQRGRMVRDERIKNQSNIDKDISLTALYERDGGVCWLCGDVCDWEDCDERISASGKKYVATGRMYPTVDHVVPLSKGGTHTWDNVKLAHKSCNISKKDKIVSVVAENS